MDKTPRWLTLGIILLFGLPLLCGILLAVAANTPNGRLFITDSLSSLTANQLTVTGLGGHFPEQLEVGRIVWQDENGVLTIDGLVLDWNPWQLLSGVADIGLVQAGRIGFVPSPLAKTDKPPSGPVSLPLAINLHNLHIGQLDLSALTGQAIIMKLDGYANLASLSEGILGLSLRDLQNAGNYTVSGQFDKIGIHARVSLEEPAQGLLAALAGLKESKPLSMDANIDGPLSALKTQGNLTWGKLKGALRGTLDAQTQQADWQISATAPAMQAHANLAWQYLSVEGTLQGLLSKPSIHSNIDLKGLRLANTGIGHINLSVQGDTGRLELTSELSKLTLANPSKDLLQAQPLTLQSSIRLDQTQRPVKFKLQHPLFNITGDAITATPANIQMVVNLPDLKPLALLAGLNLAGNSTLKLTADQHGPATDVAVDGRLAITGGDPALVKLLGSLVEVGANLVINGPDMVLSRCQLNGKAINLQADGTLKARLAKFNWQIGANDLSVVSAKTSGQLMAHGQINGPLDDFTAMADVAGELATRPFPRKPVTAKLKVEHLPHLPIGQFNANTVLAGSPVDIAMDVKPQKDQSLQFNISRADWKSLHTQGTMLLANQSPWPSGSLALTVKRLEDFSVFVGQPLSGTLAATLKTTQIGQQPYAYLDLDAQNISLAANTQINQAQLTLAVRDPANKPNMEGQLNLDGLAMDALTGAGKLDFNGTLEQLALQLSANLEDPAGKPLKLDANALFSANANALEVNGLDAVWKGQTLRLLAPATISWPDAVAVRHLRLGLEDAILQADGQISPTLDITASLHQFPLAALNGLAPDLKASGIINADAKLRGPLAKPSGSVTANGSGMRLLSANGNALPPAQFNAAAELDGTNAQIQAKFTAGENAVLNLSGFAPLHAGGILDLHTTGSIELKLLDPLLTSNGRRARGQIAINAGVAGNLSEPKLTGTAVLTKVEVRDYAIGANLTDINGLITANGGQLVIDKLQGEAGNGTVAVKGTIDVLKKGIPINLAIIARNAKPLASDRLTADINADLTLRGLASEDLLLLGSIKINRADIRIPEYLPANIAVLKLETPKGSPAPPPSMSDSDIKLNLIIASSGQIFVRGRGVDAELDGTVGVRGTAGRPRADGGFKLRRGQYTLGGKTLAFSEGKVGFDNGRLTDPSLNFVASTSSDNITATLTIAGSANKPKITLSSVPDLPQDEILARLLFSRSASSLSVLEILQIGSAVATLSGATSGMGDPLDNVRKTLGLDRLTVGGKKTSVEAGSYVVPGVYLGTRQGLSGGPQAMIQIDLTKHIKLEAAVGANAATNKNANPNSLGIIYQFEY